MRNSILMAATIACFCILSTKNINAQKWNAGLTLGGISISSLNTIKPTAGIFINRKFGKHFELELNSQYYKNSYYYYYGIEQFKQEYYNIVTNIIAKYALHINNKFSVYPQLGVVFEHGYVKQTHLGANPKQELNNGNSNFNFNNRILLGAGANYNLTKRINLIADFAFKPSFGPGNYFLQAQTGIGYRF